MKPQKEFIEVRVLKIDKYLTNILDERNK